MKSFSKSVVFILAALLANYVAAQPSLLLTNESLEGSSFSKTHEKNQLSESSLAREGLSRGDLPVQSYSLDFISDKDSITAMTLSFNVSDDSVVNVSNCLSGLPQTHTGVCEQVGNKVKVAIFSMSNQEIPAGTLGRISVIGDAVLTIDESSVSLSTASADLVEAEVLQ